MQKLLHGIYSEPALLQISQQCMLRQFATAGGNKLQLIKDLRERTGSPISDVKAALDEAQYDPENAYQVLRKKGLAAASKKASRHAAEGLIGLATTGNSAVLVEVNSETDFVAGNDQFRRLVTNCAQAAMSLASGASGSAGPQELDRETLSQAPSSSQQSVEAEVSDVVGTVRENIRLRRAFRLTAPNGIVSSYLHVSPAPGLGRIGALVSLEGREGPIPATSLSQVQDLGAKLAMHAAASSPIALDRESVPSSALEEEEAILREQLAKSRKPAAIQEKIIAGKMNKFYEERCFLDQSFIMDDTMKVKDVISSFSKSNKLPISLTGYLRLQVGEGLESETKKDFASEVEHTLRQTA